MEVNRLTNNTQLSGAKDWIAFIVCICSVALCSVFIDWLHIESNYSFYKITYLLAGASVVNAILPVRLRVFLFPLCFMVSLWLIFSIKMALIIAGCMTVFLAIIIPSFSIKIKLSLLLPLVLALICVHSYPSHMKYWSGIYAITVVLGSIFMLRTVAYLYETANSTEQVPWIQRLNYFLLAPNLAVPLFPIIDYKTFTRSYYNESAIAIYKRGLHLIVLGLVQHCIYKLIYHNFYVFPDRIDNLFTLLQFLFSEFALVLRPMSIFHISIGFICLFGYNLPDIFNHLFFADSFIELWRRINIYWKTFITKIFYYRIYLRLKHANVPSAMFLTTFICFFISWQLHSWQWYWIKGYYPITAMDALFWLIFGLMVAVEGTLQAKKSGQNGKQISNSFIASFRILLVLLTMSCLWSLWISTSVGEWILVFSGIQFSMLDTSHALFLLMAIYTLLVAIKYYNTTAIGSSQNNNWLLYACFVALMLVINTRLMPFLEKKYQWNLEIAKTVRPNPVDMVYAERGYYDNLLNGNNFLHNTASTSAPSWAKTVYPQVLNFTERIVRKEFLPNKKITYNEVTLTTNEYGMRDKSYSLQKPDSSYRIAIIGGSYEAGQGVDDKAVYETVVEDRLAQNATISKDGVPQKMELLNFSGPGYLVLQDYPILEHKIVPFRPDAVVLYVYTDERNRFLQNFTGLIQKDHELEYAFLNDFKKKHQLDKFQSTSELAKRANTGYEELNEWCFTQIEKLCVAEHITPIVVFEPALGNTFSQVEYDYLKSVSLKHHFKFWDMRNIYDNLDYLSLSLNDWDLHPNAEGHKIIADKFYGLILSNQKDLDLTIKEK